ncbi:VOC family protein [Lysinibacillus yapensis]|nr:VOC family protein [Lysinibacillus yapensis]
MFLLDHVVHFVDKPELLIEKTKEMGLHTVNGGKHEMWGTYNSLCYIGLSYIEFIGIYDRLLFEKSAKQPFTLHETYKKHNFKNGATRIALRTNDIEKDAENMKSFGLEVYGPADFSRTRPDGSVLKWKLLHVGHKDQSLEFPFIIQWEKGDEDRQAELVESGMLKAHPAGNLYFQEIVFHCEDFRTAYDWANIFGFGIEESSSSVKLNAHNCSFTFKKGTEQISQIVFAGASEEKVVEIEGTQYVFLG